MQGNANSGVGSILFHGPNSFFRLWDTRMHTQRKEEKKGRNHPSFAYESYPEGLISPSRQCLTRCLPLGSYGGPRTVGR